MQDAELMYVCWKGKVPRTTEKYRKYMHSGQETSKKSYTDVRVVQKNELHMIDEVTKLALFPPRILFLRVARNPH